MNSGFDTPSAAPLGRGGARAIVPCAERKLNSRTVSFLILILVCSIQIGACSSIDDLDSILYENVLDNVHDDDSDLEDGYGILVMEIKSNVDGELLFQPTFGRKRSILVKREGNGFIVAHLAEGRYWYWTFLVSRKGANLPLEMNIEKNKINYVGKIVIDIDETVRPKVFDFGQWKYTVFEEAGRYQIVDDQLSAEERFKNDYPDSYKKYEFKKNIIDNRGRIGLF